MNYIKTYVKHMESSPTLAEEFSYNLHLSFNTLRLHGRIKMASIHVFELSTMNHAVGSMLKWKKKHNGMIRHLICATYVPKRHKRISTYIYISNINKMYIWMYITFWFLLDCFTQKRLCYIWGPDCFAVIMSWGWKCTRAPFVKFWSL